MPQVRKSATQRRNKKGKLEWWARIRWREPDGTERSKEQKATSKRHAKALADQLAARFESEGPRAMDAERLIFSDLADEYARKKLIAPEYAGDVRIAGMRSYKRQISFLKPLTEYFARVQVQRITYEDLLAYRQRRFQVPSRRGGQRSIAQVNQELTLLRAILNYARRCGYLSRSPFEQGKGLISRADEKKRDRILTADEESRLLMACDGRRAHLRPLIIAALDTALRKGELLQLRWSDVDFAAGVITVRSTTTKTRRGRSIGITARLANELKFMQELCRGREGLIFGGIKDFKRSFATARQLAGIGDLRFHDLRHTATTRMVQTGLPSALAMTITGHTQFSTFKRYVNVNQDAARQAAALLDQLHDKEKPDESGEPSGEYIN